MLNITNLKEVKEVFCKKHPDKNWVQIDYGEYFHCGFRLSDGSFELGFFWQKEYEFEVEFKKMVKSLVQTEDGEEEIEQEIIEIVTQKKVASFGDQPQNYKQNINNLIN